MAAKDEIRTHALTATVRFVQGYRYLDRCGEALVRLENSLGKEWIPGEASPKAGSIKNDSIGMIASFNAEAMSVQQSEPDGFAQFHDQACKVYSILCTTFEIGRVLTPALKVVLQRGFNDDSIGEANSWLAQLKLCTINPQLAALVGGTQEALDFTLVMKKQRDWDEQAVQQTYRLETSVIRQEKQLPFDERLLRRATQLPDSQRDALKALLNLRRKLPEVAPVAAQVDAEYWFEDELDRRSFDFPRFLDEAWVWSQSLATKLPTLRK